MTPKSTDRCMRGREPVIRDDGAIEIPLTQGQVALVDARSYVFVRMHSWRAVWNQHTRSWLAQTSIVDDGRETTVNMGLLQMHE